VGCGEANACGSVFDTALEGRAYIQRALIRVNAVHRTTPPFPCVAGLSKPRIIFGRCFQPTGQPVYAAAVGVAPDRPRLAIDDWKGMSNTARQVSPHC
jgi:hypothetical protein